MLDYKSQIILRPHEADVISDLRSLYHIPLTTSARFHLQPYVP